MELIYLIRHTFFDFMIRKRTAENVLPFPVVKESGLNPLFSVPHCYTFLETPADTRVLLFFCFVAAAVSHTVRLAPTGLMFIDTGEAPVALPSST